MLIVTDGATLLVVTGAGTAFCAGANLGNLQTATRESLAKVYEGFLRIAVENMANAIKKISIQRGFDVTRYALVSFGAAAGQHACLVADALGIEQVFAHFAQVAELSEGTFTTDLQEVLADDESGYAVSVPWYC